MLKTPRKNVVRVTLWLSIAIPGVDDIGFLYMLSIQDKKEKIFLNILEINCQLI